MPRVVGKPALFKEQDELFYGLKISEREPKSGNVVSVQCKFCIYFGRQEKLGAKRARTSNIKAFVLPFRADNYKTHLTSQHPALWNEYQQLGHVEKRAFFENRQRYGNTLLAHFDGEEPYKFIIKRQIVDDLIASFFFHPDDHDDISLVTALEPFKNLPENDEVQVEIKKSRLFRLAIKFIANGSSFRMAANNIQATREETKMAVFWV